MRGWLNHQADHLLIQTILSATEPYLYDEVASPAIQQLADGILSATPPAMVHDFYLQIKVEELVYLLLVELLKRQDVGHYPVNAGDVRQLYGIRDQLLVDLSKPPGSLSGHE
ncbi:hypothetical protein [Spirosoma humi]